MKKFLMTVAAAFVAVSMNAQIYVGGGIGFQSQSTDGNSETAFSILPEIGYNLDETLALGIVVGYSESGKDATKVKTLAVNPYVRYTFAKFDKVNLFVDGGFAFMNEDRSAAPAGYKTNTLQIGVKPGVAVNLNDKLSFVSHVGFLGYTNEKPDYDGAKATNTFGFNFNSLSLTFGLYYNF